MTEELGAETGEETDDWADDSSLSVEEVLRRFRELPLATDNGQEKGPND